MYTNFSPRVVNISECLPFNVSASNVCCFVLIPAIIHELKFCNSVRYHLGDVALLKVSLQIYNTYLKNYFHYLMGFLCKLCVLVLIMLTNVCRFTYFIFFTVILNCIPVELPWIVDATNIYYLSFRWMAK